MIAQVTAHNFKGATFSAPLGGKVLVVGPNGVGKSSRSQALQLAVLGYVPGAGGKQNAAILDAFKSQDGKDLRAGVVLENGTKLERRFTRSRSGSVSHEMYAGGIKCTAAEFAKALADVAVVDLSVFLGLSDAKKIDELFRLFPPEGNVRDIAAKIEAQAKRIAALEREERDATSLASNITVKKTSIQLPAGTMADKQAEIDRVEAELAQARAELEAARIAAARAEQAEQTQRLQEHTPAVRPEEIAEAPRRPADPVPGAPDMVAILDRILATMDRAGCDVCAAKMVIKSELAKARRGLDRRVAA